MTSFNNTFNFLGYNVYTSHRAELISEIESTVQKNDKMTILSLNTLKLYMGEKDLAFKQSLQKFSHTIPDGQSIVFALHLLDKRKIDSISGAELMMQLIERANEKGYSIFFLGSPESLLESVAARMATDFPNVRTGYQHGYYDLADEEKVVEKIADFSPNLLFIAFGSPRKEQFILKYQDRINCNVMMGVGGSYEVFAGDKKLDKYTKKLGLRWLVRTLQDPMRLGPRYARCNSYYLYLLAKEFMRVRRQVIVT